MTHKQTGSPHWDRLGFTSEESYDKWCRDSNDSFVWVYGILIGAFALLIAFIIFGV